MTSMSRRSSKKGSSAGLRQTTLLDNLPSLSASGKRRRSTGQHLPSSSPSKKRADLEDSSSDEMAAISFVPIEKITPSSVSSGGSSPMPKASLKGKSRRVVAASPSESEEKSSLQQKVSDESRGHRSNDSEGSEPPRKKRRLHRRKSLETVASSDEDIAHLADEVEKESECHISRRVAYLAAFIYSIYTRDFGN